MLREIEQNSWDSVRRAAGFQTYITNDPIRITRNRTINIPRDQ